MANNFSVKIGEIGLFIFIRDPGIGNGLQYCTSDFNKSSTMIWLHRVNILVNFGVGWRSGNALVSINE